MATLGNTPRPSYVYDTETDTWVPIGVGAHTHSYIPNTLVDAKGDILTATADDTPARLAKGADGTVLVSDSTTSTGLAWQPYASQFVAGKNKIINGDFGIWQRGTSFTGNGVFAADRWRIDWTGNGTFTTTQQTFTPGSAPVAGYEGIYFQRTTLNTLGTTTDLNLYHKIEDVRCLSGQTVTFSFWGKADSARTVYAWAIQVFGGGGSADVYTGLNTTPFSLTTSWQRFTYTFTLPSMSGKTIGTNSQLLMLWRVNPTSGMVFDIWGAQLEAGPVATPFTTASGSIGGELALCQRYYWRNTSGAIYGSFAIGWATSTTNTHFLLNCPVPMRITPTILDYSNMGVSDYVSVNSTVSSATIVSSESTNMAVRVDATTSPLIQYRPYGLRAYNNVNSYIGLSAEL